MNLTTDGIASATARFGLPSALRRIGWTRGRIDEGDTTTAVLIVSSRHRLWQRYGDEGVFEIERAIGQLVESMAMRGLSGTLAYVDDGPILSALGVLPAVPTDADDVARVVRSLGERLALTEETARHVLIVGDGGIVPFHRLDNPSVDDDEHVLSDHPYGTIAAEPLRAARAVGRIPDAGLGVLLAALRGAAAAHRRLAAGRHPRLAPEAFGYSASIWKRAARGAFTAVGEPGALRLSPPLSSAELPHPGPDGPRYRYYNLHGLVDAAEWLGQRDPAYPAGYPEFPVALTPDDLAFAPGCVALSEACHGARIVDRARSDSIALTHVAGGALAFVGSTGVAYGGLDDRLMAADYLAHRFWRALLAGMPAGTALAVAKADLVDEALSRQGYLDAEDEKAVHSFVLYGDPSLTHHPAARSAGSEGRAGRDAVGSAGSAVPVGAPPTSAFSKGGDDRPSVAGEGSTEIVPRRDGHRAEHSAMVENVRRRVAKRLPIVAGDGVSLRVASAPRRIAKSRSAPDAVSGDGAPMVITFAKSLPTCAGPACRTVVQVTVDPRGEIRKLIVSR